MSDVTDTNSDAVTVRVPMRLERRGGRKRVITPDGPGHTPSMSNRDASLVRALVRAHAWRRRIESGLAKSITDLSAQEGVTDAYVCRLFLLTCLAPEIVEKILDGRQTTGLNVTALRQGMPVDWHEQSRRWN